VIRKGKASKPTEFGKMVKIQEAENQIITHYEVFAKRPMTLTSCAGGAETRRTIRSCSQLWCDAGSTSAGNEAELHKMA